MEDFIISIHKCISLDISGNFSISALPGKGDRQKPATIPKNIHILPVISDQCFSFKFSISGVTQDPLFYFLFFNI